MRDCLHNERGRRYSAAVARKLAQPLRAYRYTRWHWRWLFRMLDAVWCRPVDAWRRLRGLRAQDEPRSILVVQLDHLGDAVLTTAVFPLLKKRFPQARIDVLASQWNREVFANNPYIGRIHVSKRNWFGRKRGARRFLDEALRLGIAMREHEYDLGVDVRGDFLAAVLLWTARIPRRLGWGAGGGSFLLTDCPDWVPDRPEIESRVALLRPLGISAPRGVRPQLYPGRWEQRSVGRKLADAASGGIGRRAGLGGPLVVLHVSAGTDAKRWPAAHLRELVRQLTDRCDAAVVLVGE
jgi:ADP-heptose:LPS heptosyltransferase